MFPPTPKRVSGTLAGSRSGGGFLADSGLVLPPVRLVPLRTIRELETQRVDTRKPLQGQTIRDFDIIIIIIIISSSGGGGGGGGGSSSSSR